MHTDDPPAASLAARAPASSASSASSSSAVGAAASSASSAGVSAPAMAVVSVAAGSKRKCRATDNASSSVSVSSLMQPNEEDQRTAASSHPSAASAVLSVAASNAHLASVLESPSAAAPVAKRTRRAAQSAQAAAAQARASPMIRLMGTDSGARQSLFQLMDLGSIARLQRTGQSWRGWIAEAPFIGARTVINKGHQSDRPSRCPWIRRSVHHIQYEDSFSSIVPFDQLLLLQWSRLRSIAALFSCRFASAEQLRASFASVAATLQCLTVSLRWHAVPSAANLLLAISSLHQLESLTVDATCDLTGLDLSALPAMPRLQQFALYDYDTHSCSLAQVSALAQCKALTDLQCGIWLPMHMRPQSVVQLNADQLQQIEDGLGRLWRLRKDNGAAPLRRLNFGYKPMILPPCWRVLSQFTTLEELDAHWSCTLTAADWMLLANFSQLRTLRINTLEEQNDRALLDLGLVLPALVRCRALRSLELIGSCNGALQLRTEHAALLAQVPSLESFEGRFLRIESLEPLSHAPALTELDLGWCVGLHGEPINIRAMIPAMPLVNKLRIADAWDSRLTAEQAEPFNVILLARLPKLAPERFRQG